MRTLDLSPLRHQAWLGISRDPEGTGAGPTPRLEPRCSAAGLIFLFLQ